MSFYSYAETAKVIVLAIDDATLDWAKTEPSRYDGKPINDPESKDMRLLNELILRIQEKLISLEPAPNAIAWDIVFTEHTGTNDEMITHDNKWVPLQSSAPGKATEDLTLLLKQSSIPIVLPVTADDEAYDHRMYIDGENRFWGHAWSYKSVDKVGFWPLDPWEARSIEGSVITDENGNTKRTFTRITLPLAVSSFAAYLSRVNHLTKDEASSQAEKAARCLSEKFKHGKSFDDWSTFKKYFGDKEIELDLSGSGHVSRKISGIRLTKTEVETISALEVLTGHEKTLRTLTNSMIIIGGTGTGVGDKHDYFGDGELTSGVYSQAWAIKYLIEKWDEVKESDCFKNSR